MALLLRLLAMLLVAGSMAFAPSNLGSSSMTRRRGSAVAGPLPPVSASSSFDDMGLVLAEAMGIKDGRMDMSTMPDPAVPVLFTFAIIVGVGVLQLSLGDVYAEEADLGISSGINAKKEMERRSKSYFKGSGGTAERFDD